MIRFAILGAGTIAHKMACTVSKMSGVEAYAVASRDLEKAREFADRYGFSKAYGSYEEMLEDKDVDLVYVAVPHSLHYRYMKLCLNFGKHVLCEKPFTVNADQAEEILELAESRHLLAAEAMWTRYMPSRRIIDDIIASGAIGEVESLTANLGYQLRDIKRIWDINLAGGALLDVGCYLITFARMIFKGKLTGNHTTSVFINGVDAIDNFALIFDETKLASMQCSVVSEQDRSGMIFGSKGYIEVANINNPEAVNVFDSDHRKVASYEIPGQITGFEYEVEACLEAIGKGETECKDLPHAEIISVMQILDDIRKDWGYDIPLIG